MPRVIVTAGALRGLERYRRFLKTKNSQTSARAADAIKAKLSLLGANPLIGRPTDAENELRELSIAFGYSGYVALYRHDANADIVHVLAFRHQREAGYG